jgi:hypothetical protein
VTRLFKQFMRDHKLPPIRFHDLRHSHATHLLAAGIHPRSPRSASVIPASPSRWIPIPMPCRTCSRTRLPSSMRRYGWP